MISIANLVSGVAIAISSPATGLAIDRLGLPTALMATALVLLAATLLAYLAWWRAGDHASEPPAAAAG